MRVFKTFYVALFSCFAIACVGQELEIINPGFEHVSRPLLPGEITNGAGGAGVPVGTRVDLYAPPQFDDLVEVPGWRTVLPPGGFLIFTGVLNPPENDAGEPFVTGHLGQHVVAARNVWMQQTLTEFYQPNTRYTLSFLCGGGLWEPADGVFAALVASPDIETLAFPGVPGTTTLVMSSYTIPLGSEGTMLPWELDYQTPETLPGNLTDYHIAVAFVGGDGLTLMNFDEFHLVAETIGDVNQDGQVDLLDVQPFIDTFTSGVFVFQADINQDGAVDLLDVAPFVELLSG